MDGRESDYRRDLKSSNASIWIGDIQYANSLNEKTDNSNYLKLKTSNGSIKINFSK